MRRHSFGFTLVEVMIVLLIFGIISAVTIPSINSALDEMKVDGAAREVVSAIQYSQSLSIKEGTVHGVQFYIVDNKFRCFENVPGNIVLHPVEKKPYEVDFNGEGHFQGLDVLSTTFSGNKVDFNELGEPSETGSILLGYAGIQKIITVTTLTGKVTVN